MPFLDKFKKNGREAKPTSSKNSSELERTGQFVSVEGAMNLEAQLQQPVEDGTVMQALITLRSHIEAHTMTFYHKDKVAVNGAELKKHVENKILKNTKEDATALTNILLEPRSRATGIRIVIARTLFASIDFFGDPQQTLLSPAAVSLMSSFGLKERSDESKEIYQLALARWRILATFLLPTPDKKSHFKASDEQARVMMDTMNCVLLPFVNEQHVSGSGKEEREDNLALITSRAARLGTMLFSQPATWEFSWDIPADPPKENSQRDFKRTTSRRKGVVVYPAIWKTGDLDGRELSRPILKDSPEVDSSPAIISNTTMSIRENTLQSRGDPVRRREMARPDEEAVTNATRAESLPGQQSNDTSIATMGLVAREGNSFSDPMEAERPSEQYRPSNPPPLPSRERNNLEQTFVPGPDAADIPYDNDPSNNHLMARHEISREAKAAVPDSRAAGNRHGQQQFDSPTLERRKASESKETVDTNSNQLQRPNRQLQQPRSPANDLDPNPPMATTRLDDLKTAPTLPALPKFNLSGNSNESLLLQESLQRLEAKADYNKPTPMLPHQQTPDDDSGLMTGPPRSSNQPDYATRDSRRPQGQNIHSGPEPPMKATETPTGKARAEHDAISTRPRESALTYGYGRGQESQEMKQESPLTTNVAMSKFTHEGFKHRASLKRKQRQQFQPSATKGFWNWSR